ncbi:MAG: dTMP kinase [Gammaproteobacteria bacterium]|nr:dTMP kinase [Gammaproteobacteria bacterium]
MKPRFITLEGGEGAGKTTNLRFIEGWLQAQQIPFIVTREPGGTPLGEQLRALLLQQPQGSITAEAELLMMFAARHQHLHDLILPALKRGEWVVCDRFIDASYAYQGGGRGLSVQHLDYLDRWLLADVNIDCTIYLDIDVALGMQRVHQRGGLDRFEQESISFFTAVRHAYQQRAAASPERMVMLNAAAPLDVVQQQIVAALQTLLREP